MKKKTATIKSIIYLILICFYYLLRWKGYVVSPLFLYLCICLMAVDWIIYFVFGRQGKK